MIASGLIFSLKQSEIISIWLLRMARAGGIRRSDETLGKGGDGRTLSHNMKSKAALLKELKEKTQLSIPHAALLLDMSESALRHKLERNKIPEHIIFRIDSRIYLKTDGLINWINSSQQVVKSRKGG